MTERRTKRSLDAVEALQYLTEAVADRSDVSAVAIVDDAGRIVAGTGMPRALVGLSRIAGPVARGEACVDLGHVTRDTDVMARRVDAACGTLYLAALGSRVRRMPEAARAIQRIVSGQVAAAQ
jgi:hypothetical protein